MISLANNLDILSYDLNLKTDHLMKLGRYLVGANINVMNTSNDEKESMGMSLSDMLISCSFSLETCTVNDFEYYFDSFYG